ncbi:LysM peptidoglycan-binding domain-containing protein [Leptolinea tardivitalis]|uniref:LysM domain-containing protein n=1 Tax=Leptolinea tardivitalis TaxID=229920 RepID=A0A0N8GLM1_9CHLR|nr:LysM peptidoglycan-binding domain-containing protein [Leptolinea tardivitalis]KPL72882.1 hypothetical protein ADM99_07485 [Leptolinea tardivitalis]GAP20736.1 protein containing LysM domain [Leptolinea tardivitalis]
MEKQFPEIPESEICPFIGLAFDIHTAMDYPSVQNLCHQVKPYASPSLSHQREYCLNKTFEKCRLYAVKHPTSMPMDMSSETAKPAKTRKLYLWLGGALFLLIITGILIWQITRWIIPTATPVAAVETLIVPTAEVLSATIPPTQLPEATETEIPPTMEPLSLLEITVPPTVTSEPALPHLLETPIGTNQAFLLHKVKSGEDIISIAGMYQTTVDAIRAVNFNMPLELWVDTVIVVPVNQPAVNNIVPMTPYEVTTDNVTVESLAIDQGADPVMLALINKRDINYQFQSGEWVLIPHTVITP